MSTFDITKHSFTFNNIKYFRDKAEDVDLGCYGEKKDPIGAPAYLAREAKLKDEHLVGNARFICRAGIDWNSTAKAKFKSAGSITFLAINGKGASAQKWNANGSAKLDLVKFAIDEGPLKRVLNNGAGGARGFLEREGNDARIVSSVFVAMDAELAEAFEVTNNEMGGVKAELFGIGIGFTAKRSRSEGGDVTVKLSPGTTFAYGMHKVSDWNRGRTRIDDMEDDRKGMG